MEGGKEEEREGGGREGGGREGGRDKERARRLAGSDGRSGDRDRSSDDHELKIH